jgi:hypothetical protein
VVVGIASSTEDVESVGKPILGSEVELIILLDVVSFKVAVEPNQDEPDILLDDHILDDDAVVDAILEEVPLVVSVIPKVDDERVLYDVENVLSDSDTVVGVTVGTFDKLSVDDAVELKSSPATVSNPVKEAVDIEVSRLLDKDDEIEELSPTTLLLADDVP